MTNCSQFFPIPLYGGKNQDYLSENQNLFGVFLESVFLCFICLYFQDFSTISNARKLGKVLKWSWSSALEHIKARIFVFNLVPYEKIEFSKKLTSSFFKNLFKKKLFFFSKNRLWYVVATSVMYILTLSRRRYH